MKKQVERPVEHKLRRVMARAFPLQKLRGLVTGFVRCTSNEGERVEQEEPRIEAASGCRRIRDRAARRTGLRKRRDRLLNLARRSKIIEMIPFGATAASLVKSRFVRPLFVAALLAERHPSRLADGSHDVCVQIVDGIRHHGSPSGEPRQPGSVPQFSETKAGPGCCRANIGT